VADAADAADAAAAAAAASVAEDGREQLGWVEVKTKRRQPKRPAAQEPRTSE